MHVKWFFATVMIFVVILMLIGQYFIGDMLSRQNDENSERQMNQSEAHYKEAMNTTLNQFNVQNNQSQVIHEYVFDNLTDLKNSLDPVTAEIKNATQMRIDQENHYSTAIIHFKELGVMNQTMTKILEVLNGASSTDKPFVINNVTQPSVEKDRGLSPNTTTATN